MTDQIIQSDIDFALPASKAPVAVSIDRTFQASTDHGRALVEKSVAQFADKTPGIKVLMESRADVYQVNPFSVTIKTDWNNRDLLAQANHDHIDALARQIAASNAVLQPVLAYRMTDGSIIVLDGHMRVLAAIRAIETYGATFTTIPVRMHAKVSGTEQEVLRQLRMVQVTHNVVGKEFEPMELAQTFLLQRQDGMSDADIAKAASKSTYYIRQLIRVYGALNEDLRNYLREGVSYNIVLGALQEFSYDGVEAASLIADGKSVMRLSRQDKLMPKHIEQAKAQRASLARVVTRAANPAPVAQPLAAREPTTTQVSGGSLTAVFDRMAASVSWRKGASQEQADGTVAVTFSKADFDRLQALFG